MVLNRFHLKIRGQKRQISHRGARIWAFPCEFSKSLAYVFTYQFEWGMTRISKPDLLRSIREKVIEAIRPVIETKLTAKA